MLDTIRQDLFYAVRSLRRTPAFTLTALLVLGFGIGSATAIFTVLNATVLRPLPYADAERLVIVHPVAKDGRLIPSNARHFGEWRRSSRTLDALALVGPDVVTLGATSEPVRVDAGRVSPSMFRMLGVRPALGRLFRDDEDVTGRDAVIVLSHEVWATRFGSDPSIVGRTVPMDGEPVTVIGVLPASFTFPRLSQLYPLEAKWGAPQLWRPFVPTPRELRPAGSFSYLALGHLRPGVSVTQATDDISAIQGELARTLPGLSVSRVVVEPLAQQITSRTRGGLQLAFGAVIAVLLIACINITALFLARSSRRHRELAIRQAVGARRSQLIVQTLTETLTLALGSGLAGLAVGYALVGGIRRFAPADVPRLDEIGFDATIFGFIVVVSIACAAIVGMLPALRAARINGLLLMRTGAATAASTSAGRLRASLIAVEVAASAACLVAAVLLATSFARLVGVERGFRTDRLVTFELLMPAAYDALQAARFLSSVTEQIEALPGVRAAGSTDLLPLSGVSNSGIEVEGSTLPPSQQRNAMLRIADAGYFDAMGITLRRGRLLRDDDVGRPVAVISERAAEQLWPNQDPIGRRFRHGGDTAPFLEVVGIVNDLRAVSLRESPPASIFVPITDTYVSLTALAINTTNDSSATAGAVKDIVHRLDPRIAVPPPRTMEQIVATSVAVPRFEMLLVLLLAATAALLTAVGIYGVMAQAVSQRTTEFGVRQAIGASPRAIVRLVLQSALRPVAGGLAAGLLAATALGRVMSNLLFGVTPRDPLSFAGVSLLVIAVALLATYVPVRRALKIAPIAALRAE
jgi:predicted permease